MDGALSWGVLSAAALVGVAHAALGPDHWVPFIALSQARGWSPVTTALRTAACGMGHVAASVAIAAACVAFGGTIAGFDRLEAVRGGLAGWAIFAFGVAYATWGLREALRRRRGIELHQHGAVVHVHGAGHHPHVHGAAGPAPAAGPTFWSLFVVFVLGPCEPLIPLFVLPAFAGRWGVALAAAFVFAAATIATMVVLTALGSAAGSRLRGNGFAVWGHAMAGALVTASGAAVVFLGW